MTCVTKKEFEILLQRSDIKELLLIQQEEMVKNFERFENGNVLDWVRFDEVTEKLKSLLVSREIIDQIKA